jgi:phosphoethanolamine N-methyltransferase
MTAPAGRDIAYSDDIIARHQLTWGEGFLSPGGAEEVAEMFVGLDLRGLEVLDIGSGLGGVDLLLAREHGAGRVVGVDVEPGLVERAAAAAERGGLGDRLAFRLIEPGPLPFAAGSFDVVTSKDAIIQVEDKDALYAEAIRVLRPGGWLVVSDWFGGPEPYSREMHAWLESASGAYFMVTLEAAAAALTRAGFADIDAHDRNAWYREFARREVEALEGPKRARLVELVGEAQAEAQLARTRCRAAAVAQGHLRPGHLRARKPG